MDRYWLSQDEQTTGPFSEQVLVEMWEHGKMRKHAQVCLEGTEDWMDGPFLVGEILDERDRAQTRSVKEERYETRTEKKKSSAADVCFAAAVLFGIISQIILRGGPDEMGVLILVVIGLVLLILGLVMLAKAAFVRGVITVLFVLGSAMGLMSHLKFEATKREAAEFDAKLRNLLNR